MIIVCRTIPSKNSSSIHQLNPTPFPPCLYNLALCIPSSLLLQSQLGNFIVPFSFKCLCISNEFHSTKNRHTHTLAFSVQNSIHDKARLTMWLVAPSLPQTLKLRLIKVILKNRLVIRMRALVDDDAGSLAGSKASHVGETLFGYDDVEVVLRLQGQKHISINPSNHPHQTNQEKKRVEMRARHGRT